MDKFIEKKDERRKQKKMSEVTTNILHAKVFNKKFKFEEQIENPKKN